MSKLCVCKATGAGGERDAEPKTRTPHKDVGIKLGKSWTCKHWKFQNNYFVIFLHFCCIFFCIWVCHFGFVL